ncbi:MAG: YceI family protein, partial [Sphingobacteriaceae bacterium]
MSKLVVLFSLLMGISVFRTCAQDNVVSTTKGEITFFSSAPLEDIEAQNKRVISMLNTQNLELMVRVPINQFEFQNKLMQQHFNDNYLESEKYPYATFKGKLAEELDFSKPGTYDASANGLLNIHGVEQKRTLNGKLTVAPDGSVQLITKFTVALVDHKIDIPKIVFNKIAEKIAVSANF